MVQKFGVKLYTSNTVVPKMYSISVPKDSELTREKGKRADTSGIRQLLGHSIGMAF